MGKSHKHLNEQRLVALQDLLHSQGLTGSRHNGYIAVYDKVNHNKPMEEIKAIANMLLAIGAVSKVSTFQNTLWIYPISD